MSRSVGLALGLTLSLLLGLVLWRLREPSGTTRQAATGSFQTNVSLSPIDSISTTSSVVAPTSIAPSRSAVSVEERLRDLLLAIQSAGDPGLRSDLIRQLLAQIPADQIKPFLQELAKTGKDQDLAADLVRLWTEKSPADAVAWALSLHTTEDQNSALRQVATAWANSDLSSSLGWMKSMPSGSQRDAVAAAIGYEAARTDPLAALKIATELPSGADREDLAIRSIREWSAISPAAAAKWTQGVTDESLRQRLLVETASAWAATDPAAAAAFATSHLPANETLSRVAIEIVQSWSATAPAEAAAWVVSFPEGDLRNTALHQLVSSWTESHPNDVAAWINQQPAGDVKNQGYAEYAEALASKDPAAAIPVAQGIADTTLRQEKLELIARLWLDKDSNAARPWIQGSDLSTVAKVRLLTPVAAGPDHP
jgi:hypothetical protein